VQEYQTRQFFKSIANFLDFSIHFSACAHFSTCGVWWLRQFRQKLAAPTAKQYFQKVWSFFLCLQPPILVESQCFRLTVAIDCDADDSQDYSHSSALKRNKDRTNPSFSILVRHFFILPTKKYARVLLVVSLQRQY
jgi:hypothetical protein